jgi:Na+/melibiose symporter-like transporter
MIPFRRFAFFTVARDASFVTLAALLLMVAFSFEPPLAFKIGATVALAFSVGLLIRSYLLTKERFLNSEAWRSLRPEERPIGDQEQHLARAQFDELLLRFAKAASGIAGILYISALVLSVSVRQSGL